MVNDKSKERLPDIDFDKGVGIEGFLDRGPGKLIKTFNEYANMDNYTMTINAKCSHTKVVNKPAIYDFNYYYTVQVEPDVVTITNMGYTDYASDSNYNKLAGRISITVTDRGITYKNGSYVGTNKNPFKLYDIVRGNFKDSILTDYEIELLAGEVYDITICYNHIIEEFQRLAAEKEIFIFMSSEDFEMYTLKDNSAEIIVKRDGIFDWKYSKTDNLVGLKYEYGIKFSRIG